MRTIAISCASPVLLHGFLLGIEWVNDSDITIIDNKPNVLMLSDYSGEGDINWTLTNHGLKAENR